jgi:hypothetical protein
MTPLYLALSSIRLMRGRAPEGRRTPRDIARNSSKLPPNFLAIRATAGSMKVP